MTTINVPGAQSVSLKKIGSALAVDLDKMPEASLQHIFAYGLRQILNDAMASAKTEAEASASAQKRLDNLMSGTLRASPQREGDPVRKRALELASAAVTKSKGFIAACAKAGVKVTDKSAKAKALELARGLIEVDGNAYTTQAKIDVEAAKGLGDIEIDDIEF